MRVFSGAQPPQEWVEIISQVSNVIDARILNKIEVAAFSIRDKRTARWLVPKEHPEYSNKYDALEVAKKLTWLAFHSRDAPSLPEELAPHLRCERTRICMWPVGHHGPCGNPGDYVTLCPLCQEPFALDQFMLDARRDALAVQMGHYVPLSGGPGGHTSQNVFFAHRRCNFIQGDHELEATIEHLKQIARRHEQSEREYV